MHVYAECILKLDEPNAEDPVSDWPPGRRFLSYSCYLLVCAGAFPPFIFIVYVFFFAPLHVPDRCIHSRSKQCMLPGGPHVGRNSGLLQFVSHTMLESGVRSTLLDGRLGHPRLLCGDNGGARLS